MKQTFSILLIAAILYSCGNSTGNQAVSDAKELSSAIKKMQPGGVATSTGGWTMTAKIDGKNWTANSLIPPKVAGRIAGEYDGESISLPYDRKALVVGNISKFSHNNAVDLFMKDEVVIWGGYSGQMEITKVDADWAEGKFAFTGSCDDPNKTIKVTEGFFRIAMAPQK